jgi:hypothetical protein
MAKSGAYCLRRLSILRDFCSIRVIIASRFSSASRYSSSPAMNPLSTIWVQVCRTSSSVPEAKTVSLSSVWVRDCWCGDVWISDARKRRNEMQENDGLRRIPQLLNRGRLASFMFCQD